jgi:hypothetical protein
VCFLRCRNFHRVALLADEQDVRRQRISCKCSRRDALRLYHGMRKPAEALALFPLLENKLKVSSGQFQRVINATGD